MDAVCAYPGQIRLQQRLDRVRGLGEQGGRLAREHGRRQRRCDVVAVEKLGGFTQRVLHQRREAQKAKGPASFPRRRRRQASEKRAEAAMARQPANLLKGYGIMRRSITQCSCMIVQQANS